MLLSFMDHNLQLFLGTLVGFPGLFLLTTRLLLPGYFPPHESKRRAWILSTVSSALMTGMSLPFVMDFLRAYGNVRVMKEVREANGGREALGEAVCTIFAGFLISDLLVGTLCHRQHVNLVTGYVHHLVYVLIMWYALHTHQTYVFSLAAFLELPTFILALSNINPWVRNDWVFAGTFLATRILFHAWICASFLVERINRGQIVEPGMAGWGACLLLIAAFPMHVHWFKNNIFGMLRRHKERVERSASASPSLSATASPLLTATTSPLLTATNVSNGTTTSLSSSRRSRRAPPKPSPIHGPTHGISLDPGAPFVAIPPIRL